MKRAIAIACMVLMVLTATVLYLYERKLHTEARLSLDQAVTEISYFKDNLLKTRGYWNKFLISREGEVKWYAVKSAELDSDLADELNKDDKLGAIQMLQALQSYNSGNTLSERAWSNDKWVHIK